MSETLTDAEAVETLRALGRNTFGFGPSRVVVERGADAIEECARLRAALEQFKAIAAEAYREWDGDNDPRVGKLLAAMAGSLPRYRADIDAIHAALAARQDGQR